MKLADLFVGALTLRTDTFVTLRGQSDVFQRGFTVLFLVALVVGLFASLNTLIEPLSPPLSRDQVIEQARQTGGLSIYNARYYGPEEFRAQYEAYASEIAAMFYDLQTAQPNTGPAAPWLEAILGYIGQVLALPWSWSFAGILLFQGLLFHLTARWLGGRAGMAQMLGLTSLASAPMLFSSVTSLFTLLATLGGIGLLGGLTGLLGFIITIWSGVVYVKAMAVAQQFSIARAIGAIVLGILLLLGLAILAVILVGVLFVLALAPVFQTLR